MVNVKASDIRLEFRLLTLAFFEVLEEEGGRRKLGSF